jgi:hypothetical protein
MLPKANLQKIGELINGGSLRGNAQIGKLV